MHFQAAIASYRLAHYASNISLGTVLKSHLKDISTNLARSLSKVKNLCIFSCKCVVFADFC